jgi:hypothetical protein
VKLRRFFAAAFVVLVCAGVVSACDTSPTAATVNGSRIKQTALYQLIDNARHSSAYVALLQTTASHVGTGEPLQLAGEGTNTYSKQLTATALTNLITARVINQEVVRRNEQPGPAMLQSARSTAEALFSPDGFAGMPVNFRNDLVTQLAELAVLEPPLTNTSQLLQTYQSYMASFYQQVCVQQFSVIVPSSTGGVDQTASYNDALAVTARFNSTGHPPAGSPSQPGVSGGTTNCYSQEQLQASDPGLRRTVMSLAPAHASSPQPATSGYNVVAVLSRTNVPFDQNTQKAITAAILWIYPAQDSATNALLRHADVKVDPEYGKWSPDGNPPAVTPPTPPPHAPGTPASTVPSFGSTGAP